MYAKQLKKLIAYIIISISFVFTSFAAPLEIIFPLPQSATDASHSYYLKLIKLALEKSQTTNNYTISQSETPLTQGRTLVELEKKDGLVNIFQSGTSVEREKKFLTIKIPLLKGSLGKRISLIHKDNIDTFNKIKNIEDLSRLTACQGEHWPDSDILEAAGLQVTRNSSYNNMFLQLKNKHCDYFPRAIIEAYSEAKALQDPDIIVFDTLVINYPFPMYFFISPHQKNMAQDIEKGLQLAIEDGSFEELFKSDMITASLFPLSKWKDATIININNPLLPKDTPVDDSRIWMKLQPPEID